MKKIWRDVLIKGSLSTLIIIIATFPPRSMFTPSKYSMEAFCQDLGKVLFFCRLRGDILKGRIATETQQET